MRVMREHVSFVATDSGVVMFTFTEKVPLPGEVTKYIVESDVFGFSFIGDSMNEVIDRACMELQTCMTQLQALK